jgi:hypothetical protein
MVPSPAKKGLNDVYNPLSDLFRRFIALGISRRPEVAERRAENDQWIRTRGMRLGRYFVGALVLAVLVVIFCGQFLSK